MIKRIFDIVVSGIILCLLLPIYVIVFIGIKIDSPGPVFFFQNRLGKNGEIFRLFKFRTMTHKKREVSMEILPGNNEVTWFGELLRRFKIDETPQFINVFIGDMSIVGPRPSMPEMIHELDDNGKYRIKVKPGITGLAQISGNIYLSWPERWVYDRTYVENHSLFGDIKIIFTTIILVIVGEKKFLKRK